MSRLILRLIVNAIALWVAIKIIPGIAHDGSTLSLLAIALVFGLVNALIRPILLFRLSSPWGYSFWLSILSCCGSPAGSQMP